LEFSLRVLLLLFSVLSFGPAMVYAEPWHKYSLDKLVNQHCQPTTMARIRFISNERGLWSAVSTAAELELEYHAAGGGVSGYCSASKGAKLLRCQAYIKSYILRAQNCNILAKQQLRLLRN
jgi:hypothetical protein